MNPTPTSLQSPDSKPDSTEPGKPVRPKNWLLLNIRQYHGWLGVLGAVFILTMCITGILLNHEERFLGKKRSPKPSAASQQSPATNDPGKSPAQTFAFNATIGFASARIGIDDALKIAAARLGGEPLEKFEFKIEAGNPLYRIKTASAPQQELTIHAITGEASVKADPPPKPAVNNEPKPGFLGYNWPKLIKDLHTGKLGGDVGMLFIDLVSLTIITLTLSGFYLWYVPRKRKAVAHTA